MLCNCRRCMVSMLEKGERYKIFPSSLREWHNKEGKLHREDGPAIEWADGYKVWYLNGKRHRKDGPAIEYSNGYKAWYINNKIIAQQNKGDSIRIKDQEMWNKMKPFNKEK